jgi:hypothetical protein
LILFAITTALISASPSKTRLGQSPTAKPEGSGLDPKRLPVV